jgi:dihydrofolate synthase/folylpolyglutamate synthase
LFRRDREWRIVVTGDRFDYTGSRTITDLRPSLPGAHQIDNAALAVAALDRIAAFRITDEQFRAGLAHIDWPARLQRLATGKLAALLRPGAELWLDGAHNDDAARVLAAWMQSRPEKFDAVIGMLSTKDAPAFLARLAPHIARLRTVTIPGEQASLTGAVLADIARKVGYADVKDAPDVASALRDLAPAAQRVMITGSLYLAGTVLAENG